MISAYPISTSTKGRSRLHRFLLKKQKKRSVPRASTLSWDEITADTSTKKKLSTKGMTVYSHSQRSNQIVFGEVQTSVKFC